MSFAMIFPGQGYDLDINTIDSNFKSSIIVKNTFEEASDYLNVDLWKKWENVRTLTVNNYYCSYVQPIILSISVATYRLWEKIIGIRPTIMAGHSLGEYSALVCSNVASFVDIINIVREREKIMFFSSKKKIGCMLLIVGLTIETVKRIIRKYFSTKIISIACINSRKKIVVSGERRRIQKMIFFCKVYRARIYKILPIHIAAHSYLMKSGAVYLHNIIKNINFNYPINQLVSNSSMKCQTSCKCIKKSLIKQLYETVHWDKILKYIQLQGINMFVEVGINQLVTRKSYNIKNCIKISLENINDILMPMRLMERDFI